VYRLATDGTSFTVLHSFTGLTEDGSDPRPDLIVDSAGNLYGTTYGSCSHGLVCPTAFRVTPDGTYAVLHYFDPSLNGNLIVDRAGNVFGTTVNGGEGHGCLAPSYPGCGTVFKLAPDGTYSLLYSFCGKLDCTDGGFPRARLVADGAGNLYGTTSIGGAFSSSAVFGGAGTVFQLSGSGFVTDTPFRAFRAKLEIASGRKQGSFDLSSSFVLGSSKSNGIHPLTESVILTVGAFKATIPAGSFERHGHGSYTFEGKIGGVWLEASLEHTGTLRYTFDAEAKGASLHGIKNPVPVTLTIGNDSGTTSVEADINRRHWHWHWHWGDEARASR